jgi:hypothetical protein
LGDGLSMGVRGTAHKKGGVDGLGKLRSGAKRNGVILTLLIGGRRGRGCLRCDKRKFACFLKK